MVLAPALYLIPLAAVVNALPGSDLYAAGQALLVPASTAAGTAAPTAVSEAATV